MIRMTEDENAEYVNTMHKYYEKGQKSILRIKSPEGIFFKFGKKGKSMFTEKTGKDIEAIAAYYKRDVITERFFAISPATMESVKLIKITLK